MIQIEVANEQSAVTVCDAKLIQAARMILRDKGPRNVQLSVAVVDDATIHALNKKYLQHDYPTDVMSFVLDQSDDLLAGEIVVSGDTAAKQGTQFGWRAEDELLLYLIHGVLHLVGIDDHSDVDRLVMRREERAYLDACGVRIGGAFE